MKSNMEIWKYGNKKKKKRLITLLPYYFVTLLLYYFIIFVTFSNAEFNDLGCGARPLGMGSAFVALADDINAIYYNPAGLVRLQKNEFTSSYGRLYVGLDDESNLGWGFSGYAQPLGKYGTIGLGYLNFALLGDYTENTFIFTYSKWISHRFAMGLNLKLLKQKIFQDSYTSLDPVFEFGTKDTVQGLSIDAGYIYNFTEKLSFGVSFYNINQPDMGFFKESKLNMMKKAGISYRGDNIATALDFSIKNNEAKVYAGGERLFFKNSLAVRSGLGFGANEFRNFTLGLGYSFRTLQFDYAFLFPIFGINDIYGSHRVSLILRFGAWPKKLKPLEELSPKDIIILQLKKDTEKIKSKYTEKTDELKQKIKYYEKYQDEKIKEAVKEELLKAKEKAAKKKSKKAAKKKKEMKPKEKKAEKEEVKKPAKITHKVKKGETLKDIAKKHYNDVKKWKIIYDANRDKIERGKPKLGSILTIPAVK